MIKSRTNSNQQVFDALSLTADLVILGGNIRQMFYTTENTFEDDRKWVPCILGGKVYVNDPANIMSGYATLTDIEWYTRMPIEGDYQTGRITNPAQSVLDDVDVYDEETGELTHEAAWRSEDYLISDGSEAAWCGNVPNLCLIVHKNVTHLTAMPIYAVLKFVDTRTGLTMRILKSIDFTTECYNTEMTVMKGDSGDEVLLDPLSFSDTIPSGQTILDIPWPRSVSAQLIGVDGEVPDTNASYLWVTEDSTAASGWRQFTEEEIENLQLTGVKTKTLHFDARMIQTKFKVRCYGKRKEANEAWQNPLAENNPFYTIQFTMSINDTLHAEPVQLTGNKQDVAMSIRASYEMRLRYNGRDVPENRRCLFRIHWKAQDLRTGSVIDLGTAPNISFIPNAKGFSFPEGFNVWADISLYSGCDIVVENGSQVIEDNQKVISPSFE